MKWVNAVFMSYSNFCIKQSRLFSVLIWMILIVAHPFVFCYALNFPGSLILILLSFLMLAVYVKLARTFVVQSFCVFWGMIVFFSFLNVYHSDLCSISNVVQVLIVFLICTVITNCIGERAFCKQYVYLLTIIVFLGFIGWLSVLMFNYPPLFNYTAQDGRPVAAFLFTVCNTYIPPVPHPIIRYSGIFDEPGTLAFFSMIALCINELMVNNKTCEVVLLILPIMTFSLAHILTLLLFYLFFYITSIQRLLVFASVVSGLIFLIISQKDISPYNRIYELSLHRLEQDDERGFQGNNRSESTSNAYKLFIENKLLGVGVQYEEEHHGISTNPFTILALYGIVGYLIVQIFFWRILIKSFVSKWKFLNWNCIKCLVILFVNFQQRPFTTNVFTMFSVLLLLSVVETQLNMNYKRNVSLYDRNLL